MLEGCINNLDFLLRILWELVFYIKMTIVEKQPPSYSDIHDANVVLMRVTAKSLQNVACDSPIHSFTHKYASKNYFRFVQLVEQLAGCRRLSNRSARIARAVFSPQGAATHSRQRPASS